MNDFRVGSMSVSRKPPWVVEMERYRRLLEKVACVCRLTVRMFSLSLSYMSIRAPTPWSGNALTVLQRRYLRRDGDGRVSETPEQMLRRVARAVAAAETRHAGDPESVEARFYEAMARLEF